MKKNTAKKTKNNFIQAIALMLLVSVVVYLVLRAVFMAYAQYTRLEKVIAFVFLFSEASVMLHSFAYSIGIFKVNSSGKFEPDSVELKQFLPVDILIPARHEPKEVLESTIITCYNLTYPSKTIHILDDSSLQKYKDEAAEIAKNIIANFSEGRTGTGPRRVW